MIRFRAAAAALALAALASSAGAAADGPEFVSSLKKALATAKERGSPVLLWIVQDGEGDNMADQATLKNRDVQRALAGYLVLLCNDQDAHGTKDGVIDGKPAKVCALAPGTTCADHKRAIDDAYRTYGDVCVNKSSELKTPCHFVVDPDGKVLGTINNGTVASGFSVVSPAAMVTGLKALLAKAGGPGLTDAQYDRFQKLLAAGRNLVDGGRMSEAAKTLKPISDFRKNIALVAEARELLVRVDREAAALLARGKAELAEKPLASLALLDRVAEDYPGTDSAEAAAKEAEAFRSSPEGKKSMKEMAREKEGRAELEKAAAAAGDDDGRLLRSLDALARKYDGLPVAEEARSRAEAIRGDAGRMKAVKAAEDERAAKSALVLARGMKDGGRTGDAKGKLREILDRYPDTEAAKEAAKLLEELR